MVNEAPTISKTGTVSSDTSKTKKAVSKVNKSNSHPILCPDSGSSVGPQLGQA